MNLIGDNLSERGQRVTQCLANAEVRRLILPHPEFFHGDEELGHPADAGLQDAGLQDAGLRVAS